MDCRVAKTIFPEWLKVVNSKFNQMRYPHWLKKHPILIVHSSVPRLKNAILYVVEVILQQKDSFIIACLRARDRRLQAMGEINILESIGHFIIVEFKTSRILQSIFVSLVSFVKYFLKVWIRK